MANFSTLTCALVVLLSMVYAVSCKSADLKDVKKSLKFPYPDVQRNESVKDDYFGRIVSDPYRWLEDPDSPETARFVQQENNLTVPYLEAAEGRELIQKKLELLQEYAKYYIIRQRKSRYFFFKKEGLQNQYVLYVQEGLHGKPRVLVDPNELRADGTVAINTGVASDNGEIYAYALSSKGSDWVTIYFKNVTSGENFPETLQHTKWPGIEWSPDNVGIYYARYPEPSDGQTADGSETTANYDAKIYFHKVGTPQSEDVLLVEFPDQPKWSLSVDLSDDGQYLIVNAREAITFSQIYYLRLNEFVKSGYQIKPQVYPLVDKFEARYDYVASQGDVIYFRTDKDAPNYRVVGIYLDSPEEKYWSVLLPENKDDVLDFIYPINGNQMVAVYTHDVKSILQLRRLTDGSLIKEFNLDVGSITTISGERHDTQFFFDFETHLNPQTTYVVDLTNPNSIEANVYRKTGPASYDSSLYTVKQVFYHSKDGTKVPMFVIHKKDLKLDGSSPTLLYGYGGFGVNLDPEFSTSRIAFIQLFDGIVAIANLRGGGEYGTKWHDDGRLLNKQNVFDDFQAAAEYLISNKYTTPSKLTIQGGSNGGLLVGACVNQRPDLFGAAVAQVGVMDMLRYHKFTIGYAWASDFGTSDDKVDFDNLIKYSPLHNIRVPENESVQYPAVLVTTGDHDDRVVPLHSFKYIAELQQTVGSSPKQTNPLMILVETNAGHGGGKPTSKKIAEVTDMFSFIVRALNLKVASK